MQIVIRDTPRRYDEPRGLTHAGSTYAGPQGAPADDTIDSAPSVEGYTEVWLNPARTSQQLSGFSNSGPLTPEVEVPANWAFYYETDGGSRSKGGFATIEDAMEAAGEAILGTMKFWDEKVRWHTDYNDRTPSGSRVIRCNGRHYTLGPGNAGGFGGTRFKFAMVDTTTGLPTGEFIETRDLWHQGTIPREYRLRLPDNAIAVQSAGQQGTG